VKKILILLVLVIAGGIFYKYLIFNVQYSIPKIQESKIDKHEVLIEEIKEMTATASGTWTMYVYRTDGGGEYGFNQNEVMPGASIMKLPALLSIWDRVDSGQLTVDSEWKIESADIAPGSGPMQFMKPGTLVTVERVMSELGKKSDNTAWRMINRRIGYEEIENRIQRIGLLNTNYRELTTTPADVGKMWMYIYTRPELWGYLEDSIYEDRISLGLPRDARLVHKVGTDAGVWIDSGIIMGKNPFILVILNEGVDRDEAQKLVPEITRRVWELEQ